MLYFSISTKLLLNDEEKWFQNVFVTGPGFQIAQIFVETIFDNHVNWTQLLQCDDNYKNILQVKIQKEFKNTPIYMETRPEDDDGYHMGVYICLGNPHIKLYHKDKHSFSKFWVIPRNT